VIAPAPTTAAAVPVRLRWSWILDQRNDLGWYIGSALVGWFYLALVLALGRGLADPMHDPIATLQLGGIQLDITLKLLVVASWGYLADAPHLFATLARTYLDPDEWKVRKAVLLKGWSFFFLGPAVVLTPYAIGALLHLPGWTLGLGSLIFTVFFQLWAYYHVVRQHWGFLRLYQRKGNEFSDESEMRMDFWFFHLTLYLPLVRFLTAPWYGETAFPPLGLQSPIWHGISISDVLHPLATALYVATLLGYVLFQVSRARAGATRNGSKLLFLASIVPLHGVVFAHPLLVSFVLPVVTVGHNLQYHRIVWSYGAQRYREASRPGWLRQIFTRSWLYLLLGLVFTFAAYHGPWVDWAQHTMAGNLDRWLFDALATMAGAQDVRSLELGAEVVGWVVMGWAMQHYYLDSHIWRVSRDAAVQKALRV
jgi:uncharacterized membrane protein